MRWGGGGGDGAEKRRCDRDGAHTRGGKTKQTGRQGFWGDARSEEGGGERGHHSSILGGQIFLKILKFGGPICRQKLPLVVLITEV